MTAIKTHLFWSLVVLIVVTNVSDSRYLKNEMSNNDLTNENEETFVEDEDIDLETFSNDYYDDLWHHLEFLIQSTEKALEKAKEKENQIEEKKPAPVDYDYMSDMPVAKPENEERRFKGLAGKTGEEEKENLTWPFGNPIRFNGSSSSNGIPEALRAYRESNSQEEYPLRSKEMRIKSIKDQVLKFRGGSPRSNETIPDARQYNALSEIYEKNIKRIQNEEWTSPYTEKVQSFYPSCDIPRNTDEDVWSDTQAMNLLFDIDYPSPQDDSTIMIVSAKLRLYKLPQENYSTPVEGPFGKVKERTQNGFGILPSDDDRQIRVSVYWYTKSLKKNRVKKKLLDSHMLPVAAPKWVEFNIRPAVRTWKESSRNFGLVVNVEDEDGNLLPADQYIHSMNCSKWTANVRPIPSIVLDRVNQFFIENYPETKNETSPEEPKNEGETSKIYTFQPLLYPLIDLCTREVPNSDVTTLALMNSAKKALESEFLNLSRRGFGMGNDSVSLFLRKNNMDLKDLSKLSRVDKSVPRKSETRVSYFQNVPIGSPSTNQNSNVLPLNKRGRETTREGEIKFRTDSEAESHQAKEEPKEIPRIRHNRKQWEMFQKTANSNSRLRNDFNVTDHH